MFMTENNTGFIIDDSQKLQHSFYIGNDVVGITKALLGKVLVTNFDDQLTAGRIVEVEAYNGPFDKAAHSYNNRRTKRTEVMFAEGGVAYVYLCYGIHQMLNVVTNVEGIPNAILIRAVEPIIGIDIMLQRCNKTSLSADLTRGPGNVARAFGIHTMHSGVSLQSAELYITDDGNTITENSIGITKRIGVDYAAEDAIQPYRFIIKGNRYVSGKKSLNSFENFKQGKLY